MQTETELTECITAEPLSVGNDDPRAAAEELGLIVIPSDETTLQIDLDSPTAYTIHLRLINALIENLPDLLARVTSTKSKSGNRHVYIQLNEPLPVETRILLQAALGSDPMRELLSYIRTTKGIQEEASVLFETESEAKRAKEFMAF